MRDLRAASVQFNHQPGDKQANREIMRGFVEAAAARDVEMLVFPEMCVTGYWHLRDYPREAIERLAEPVPDGETTRMLLALSERHGMTIGAGLIEAADDGRLYNTYVAAMPDGRTARHRKLHCFINPHMSSGDAFTVFDTPHGCRTGILICYDNNILENARMTTLMGAEVLMAPHQTGGTKSHSPRALGRIDPQLWERRHEDPDALRAEFRGPKGRAWLMRWLPARAHDNGLFLLFANGVGRDDDEIRTGGAMILDPYGEVLAETDALEDDMVVADLVADEQPLATGRRWLRARRPELYGLLHTATGQEKDIRAVRFDPDERWREEQQT